MPGTQRSDKAWSTQHDSCDGGSGPDTGRYETRYERYDEMLFEVVRAVATVLDEDPTALPPLRAIVDADGLEDVLHPPTDAGTQTDLTVSFTYAGCRVTVTRKGVIEVVPPDDDQETAG